MLLLLHILKGHIRVRGNVLVGSKRLRAVQWEHCTYAFWQKPDYSINQKYFVFNYFGLQIGEYVD